MKGNYKIADIPFTIEMKYPFVKRMCANYETDTPGICISVSDEEREREIALGERFSEGYRESAAIYRKLCEAAIAYDTFMFHCSAVALDGQAYLFTAPSGTGKSTHTRMWREVFGERAIMVNDDKPLIKVGGDLIWVCGTPWNGKHNLDSNQKVPIKGICILERGTVNHIETISAADAFQFLYRQAYHPADREKMVRTVGLLKQVAERVPLYRMQCDISHQAAKMAWEKMSGRKEEQNQ